MPAAFLKVVSGSREGLNIPLSTTEPLIIGRRRGDLLLDDAMCSSTHAQIIPREDGWMLQDLGSTNGTMVDGRLIQALRPGAEISIGNTTLVLFIGMPGEIGEQPSADPVPQAPRRSVELAWLLDEELIELKAIRIEPEETPTSLTRSSGCLQASTPSWKSSPGKMRERSIDSLEAISHWVEKWGKSHCQI